MRKFAITRVIVFVTILSGCATVEKSTLLGTGIGLSLGTSFGLLASSNEPPSRRTQGPLIGAAVGGLLGGFIGYQSYKDKQKKEAAEQASLNLSGLEMFGNAASNGNRPTLKPAQIKVRYVEDQIKDGTFVPAHFEYEISEPARWSRSK